jgi:hypothetical protein
MQRAVHYIGQLPVASYQLPAKDCEGAVAICLGTVASWQWLVGNGQVTLSPRHLVTPSSFASDWWANVRDGRLQKDLQNANLQNKATARSVVTLCK